MKASQIDKKFDDNQEDILDYFDTSNIKMLNEEVKKEIYEFELHIDNFWRALNTEGVWLFIATLGCWSVDQKWAQIFAIIITFSIFTYRISSKQDDKRTFSKITKDIENKIKNKLKKNEDTMKARLHDLNEIKNVKLSTKNSIKSNLMFLMCYSFLGVTLIFEVFK